MQVKSIHIYPLKGAGGVSLTESALLAHGFAHDRCWVPVDEGGKALLQWAHPKLAQVQIAFTGSCISLSAPGMQELDIATPDAAAPTPLLQIKKREMQAHEAASAVHEWFSDFLGTHCKLLYREDTQSGGTPIHITTTASLTDLNRRTGADTPMDRFRPNIVIETDEPWIEDCWHRVRIGATELEIVKPCARCEVITTDQQTGLREDDTLLDALKQFRTIRQPDKIAIAFGLNASPLKTGMVRLHNILEVLSQQEAPQFAAI